MTNYKIVKDFGQKAQKVGDTLYQRTNERAAYTLLDGNSKDIHPHELALMVHAGFLEEVSENKEWNPRELNDGDDYYVYDFHEKQAIHYCWFYDRSKEWHLFQRYTKNCHPTRAAAEAWRDKLLADYK